MVAIILSLVICEIGLNSGIVNRSHRI